MELTDQTNHSQPQESRPDRWPAVGSYPVSAAGPGQHARAFDHLHDLGSLRLGVANGPVVILRFCSGDRTVEMRNTRNRTAREAARDGRGHTIKLVAMPHIDTAVQRLAQNVLHAPTENTKRPGLLHHLAGAPRTGGGGESGIPPKCPEGRTPTPPTLPLRRGSCPAGPSH